MSKNIFNYDWKVKFKIKVSQSVLKLILKLNLCH